MGCSVAGRYRANNLLSRSFQGWIFRRLEVCRGAGSGFLRFHGRVVFLKGLRVGLFSQALLHFVPPLARGSRRQKSSVWGEDSSDVAGREGALGLQVRPQTAQAHHRSLPPRDARRIHPDLLQGGCLWTAIYGPVVRDLVELPRLGLSNRFVLGRVDVDSRWRGFFDGMGGIEEVDLRSPW